MANVAQNIINAFAQFSRFWGEAAPAIADPGAYGVVMMGVDLSGPNWIPFTLNADGSANVAIVNPATGSGSVKVSPARGSNSNTFTVPANGTSVGFTEANYLALQVVATGAVTSWTVVLEATLDAVNYSTIITHTQADGSGTIKFGATPTPVQNFRPRCVAIVLGAGTNVVASSLGTAIS